MAIKFDTSIYSSTQIANPVYTTFSYAGNTNANNIYILSVFVAGTTSRTGGAPVFNGQTMQQVFAFGGTAFYEVIPELWYIYNPIMYADNSVNLPNNGLAVAAFLLSAFSSSRLAESIVFDTSIISQNTTADPSARITPSKSGGFVIGTLGSGYIDAPSSQTHIKILSRDEGSYSFNAQYAYPSIDSSAIRMGWTVPADDSRVILASWIPQLDYGGILKIYYDNSWQECPSSKVKRYNGSSWVPIEDMKFNFNQSTNFSQNWWPARTKGDRFSQTYILYQDGSENVSIVNGIASGTGQYLETSTYISLKHGEPTGDYSAVTDISINVSPYIQLKALISYNLIGDTSTTLTLNIPPLANPYVYPRFHSYTNITERGGRSSCALILSTNKTGDASIYDLRTVSNLPEFTSDYEFKLHKLWLE